jgi:AraC-like DNA-binding protein
MDMMVLPAPPQLKGRVAALWALRGRPPGRYAGLPKPFAELVVSLSGVHHWQPSKEASPITFVDGWLTPVQSGPRYAATSGELHLIGARIDPLASARLFGLPAGAEVAAPVPLEALLGHEAGRFRDRLLEAPSDGARLGLLAAWLADRLADRSPAWLPPADTQRRLGWRVDALADALDLSPRGLRKRFAEQIGIGPKLWLQLGRFDALLRHQPARGSLADLAAEFGYVDQAHMSAEFARFAGVPPGRYGLARRIRAAPPAAPHFLPGVAGAEKSNPSTRNADRLR